LPKVPFIFSFEPEQACGVCYLEQLLQHAVVCVVYVVSKLSIQFSFHFFRRYDWAAKKSLRSGYFLWSALAYGTGKRSMLPYLRKRKAIIISNAHSSYSIIHTQ
jgi:hypothetical protein